MSRQKYDFSTKVALVTGSSSGIGAAIAIQFAQYGTRVTITGRNEQNLEQVATKIKQISGNEPLVLIGDMTDSTFVPKLIQQTVDRFDRLDILVNNAGGLTPQGSLAHENLLDNFDKVMSLNVRSVVQLTQLAVPELEKTSGNIINISSVSGLRPGNLVYSTSKAAVDMITKTAALELGPKGIRVNSINPGPIYTGIGRSINMTEEKFNKFMEDNWKPMTVLNRIGFPKEVANLASFLASDDAVNITGSLHVTDGGRLLK